MALRLLKIILPETSGTDAVKLLKAHSELEFWQEEATSKQYVASVLVPAEASEKIMDLLERRFDGVDGFRMILMTVEATVPRHEPEPAEAPATVDAPVPPPGPLRISREELLNEIQDGVQLNRVYLAIVLLSTIVASLGLLRNSLALIIGAMVLAPLLGPNVGLSLATTLGDLKLGRDALKTLLAGLLTAFALSLLMGLVLPVLPDSPEIQARTVVGLSDIVLALVSGCAGVLAFTTGIASALIGVMVAVALLPPLAVCGMLLGAGHLQAAAGAGILLLTNIICVNLAGVLTFLFQGIRPRTWWETQTARKATRIAIILWSALLLLLIGTILLAM
jgi:uncharacterized hydrophobic protein (TIGR00341 family)